MIFYFSGTGNTRWAAKRIAQNTEESLFFIPQEMKKKDEQLVFSLKDNERIGFFFPVYSWGPPIIVMEFLKRLRFENYKKQYSYFFCTCGDDIGRTHQIFKKALKQKGITLDAAFTMNMPDCYVCLPGFDVDIDDKRKEKLNEAPIYIKHVTRVLHARKKPHFELKPGLFPRIKSYIIRPFFNKYLITDRPFRVTDTCIACSKCASACPVDNIDFFDGKPHWQGHCTGCLACYHSCPVKALQFGNRTKGKGQYLLNNYLK